MIGAGTYDTELERLMKELKADGVILIVCNGTKGSGFGVTMFAHAAARMPGVLRDAANQMEKDLKELSNGNAPDEN